MLSGIDVSVYQGTIDWQAVKRSGIHFAGMKATESLYYPDPQFERNWQESKKHGVRRIAYHFFHADMSGIQQADHFHDIIHRAGGLHPGDCAMLDIEQTNGQSGGQLVHVAEQFVTRFLATTQCGLYIYTGPWFWTSLLGNPRSKILGQCPLWLANWGARMTHIDNWLNGASIWQWSSTGSIPGISAQVDLDRFLGTTKQYDELATKGGRA